MKMILNFLQNLNFRPTFTVLLLVAFLLLVGTPFWIGSKELNTHSWTYLSTSIGVIGTLLTLAGRNYFEKKDEKSNISNSDNICPYCLQEKPSNIEGNDNRI